MTPINNIPLVTENTTDPAAGLNASINEIDALIQIAVVSIQNDPPPSPSEGDRYIVLVGTGDWAGQDNMMARYFNSAWTFHNVKIVLNLTDDKLYVFGSSWAEYSASANQFVTSLEETSTARSLALSDAAKWIRCTNAGGCTITVPEQASIAWLVDTEIHGRGTVGEVTFTAGSGVTINVESGFQLKSKVGGVWTLKREAENSWILFGSLVAV